MKTVFLFGVDFVGMVSVWVAFIVGAFVVIFIKVDEAHYIDTASIEIHMRT